jgi:NADH-quinone oxidoreductase subunit A
VNPALGKYRTDGRPRLREPGGCLRGIFVEGWLPIVVMIALSVVAFSGGLFASNFLLGPKNPTPEKSAPYECGMPAVGDARERQSVKFYLVAMIFLLFDIEVAFLYPYAMAMRDLRWVGYFQILVFFLLLVAGYIYIWRKGALDWGVEDRVKR